MKQKALDWAFELGVKDGAAGKSKSNCPYLTGSDHGKAYHAGRNIGFESATSKALKPGFTPEPEGVTRVVRGFNGELLSERLFRERTGSTCSCCDDVVEFGDKVKFFTHDAFFCTPCVEQEQLATELRKIA